MTESSEDSTVLVVDDDAEVADVYALRLRDEYDVETAHGGAEALETVDDSEDVTRLRERSAELKADLDETLAEFDDATAAFQEIDHDP